MSAGNVDVVRAMNAAFNAGERDALLGWLDPDAEWSDLMHAPDTPESVRGVAAIRAIWAQWEQAFDRFRAQTDEYIEVGDCVVTVTRWHAEGGGSGLPIDLQTAEVYEFRAGRIVRATLGYADREAALLAAQAARGRPTA